MLNPFVKLNLILMAMSTAPLLLPTVARSQWRSIGPVTAVDSSADGIVISADPAKVRISVLAPDVVRIRMSRDGTFSPDSSWSVVDRNLGDSRFSIATSPLALELVTSRLKVHVERSPCRLSFYDSAGTLVSQDDSAKGMGWSRNEIACWKAMPQDESYFGFGEKAGSLGRKWKSMSMWNSDIPAYRADTDPLYQSIPFFYGIRNGTSYGIFFDNTYFSYFNMGKENPDQYSFGALDGELNYYFIYGPTPAEVLRKYARLTGTMPLPPKWAIAYQQCRYSYYPESRVREIASTFRSKKIPCDVIYLDIDYMDGYRCFTWDKTRFPDPKKLVGDLSEEGFKMVTIIDPGIKQEEGYWVYDEGIKGNHFVKYPDGRYFSGRVWPGMCLFPDFTRKETREWWGTLYKGLIGTGIRGFWNDMNEPAVFDVPTKTMDLNVVHDDRGLVSDHRKNHNVYGMQMARGTREGMLKLRPNERPFVLTRASYAGGHRYAAAWTGDNISSWEHLELAVPMCLNLSISGQPFVGTDIGGFVGSPGGELYTRWLQLGVFTPLMRTHTEKGTPDQEPWSFGAAYEKINKKSIELRYRLLPYIYSQFYQASRTGIPLMRPLFFDFPGDKNTYWNNRDFLFGDAFLVAPVLWPGSTKRDVRLPSGDWYDYWTGEKFLGLTTVRVDAPIDRIPLFVKAGSIIPTQQVVQYSDEAPVDPLTLQVFPSAGSLSTMYEDDGISFDYQGGQYCLRAMASRSDSAFHELVLSTPEGSYRPPARRLSVEFHAAPSTPATVSVNGAEVPKLTGSQSGTGKTGWSYDRKNKILTVRCEDTLGEMRVTAR
jgi:alpha-glucosidase